MRRGRQWMNRRARCERHSTMRAGWIAIWRERRNKQEHDMSTLKGKVAWITGAGSGIGLAGAEALAEAGATVILSGRRPEPIAAAAKKIGAAAEAVALDVADRAAVERVAQGIVQRHGRVDILVNSAGFNVPNRFFANIEMADWDRVIGANLSGTLYCIHAVLPA